MIPSDTQIEAIPLANAGEFEMLSDKELLKTRQKIYAINKLGVRLYRTIRAGKLLMVWRIR